MATFKVKLKEQSEIMRTAHAKISSLKSALNEKNAENEKLTKAFNQALQKAHSEEERANWLDKKNKKLSDELEEKEKMLEALDNESDVEDADDGIAGNEEDIGSGDEEEEEEEDEEDDGEMEDFIDKEGEDHTMNMPYSPNDTTTDDGSEEDFDIDGALNDFNETAKCLKNVLN